MNGCTRVLSTTGGQRVPSEVPAGFRAQCKAKETVKKDARSASDVGCRESIVPSLSIGGWAAQSIVDTRKYGCGEQKDEEVDKKPEWTVGHDRGRTCHIKLHMVDSVAESGLFTRPPLAQSRPL